MKDMLKDRVVAAIGDEFDIGDELGRGGMSVVYRALDLRLMRQVAVKVLPPEFAWDSGVRERFRREAQTAAQLNHPHIVPIFSVDERGGIAYFVMAECEGETLGARLARTGKAPLSEAHRILMEVADALAYAHNKGVVHRDIKPDNILIERSSGRALVTDFGIARAAEGGGRLTVTGITIGTPAYMSPEQALGESELDARSDIYSWGAVAYRMVCGVTPFTATNTPSLLLKHVSEELVPVSERRLDVPPRLAHIVERALRKKAALRWQTAHELLTALQDQGVLDPRAEAPRDYRPPSGAPSPARNERWVRPTVGPQKRTTPLPTRVLRDEEPHHGDGALRAEWFAARRREQMAEVNWRIRWLRLITPLGISLAIVVTMLSFALLVDPEEEIFFSLLFFIFPAALACGFVAAQIRWLRRRGISFMRALRAKKSVSYTLSGSPELNDPTVPVSAEVLEGPIGSIVWRASLDRDAVAKLLSTLPAEDRNLLPDVLPTVTALMDRILTLAPALHELHKDVLREDTTLLAARIERAEADLAAGIGSARTVQLLRRQHATVMDLIDRKNTLQAQVESAAILLQNIKLDLRRVSAGGMSVSIGDVNSATQEARALSREIGHVLSAADDVRKM